MPRVYVHPASDFVRRLFGLPSREQLFERANFLVEAFNPTRQVILLNVVRRVVSDAVGFDRAFSGFKRGSAALIVVELGAALRLRDPEVHVPAVSTRPRAKSCGLLALVCACAAAGVLAA